MEKIKEMIREFMESKNFQLDSSQKKILLALGVILGLLVILLLLDGDKQTENELSQSFEQQIEQDKENMETPLQIEDNNVPPQTENPFVTKDTQNEEQATIPDLSGQNFSQQEQEEIIKEIAKKQKPSDMIAFLKEAQIKFDFLKTQRKFKYEMKNYQVGDIFLWWEIEEITPIYIRFKEEDYSYNLRFLD